MTQNNTSSKYGNPADGRSLIRLPCSRQQTLDGANKLSHNQSFRDRQVASAKAKAALLEKFRAASRPDDPQRKAHDEERLKIVDARKARAAERKAARIAREKTLAEEAARETERIAAEQRAAVDAAQRAAREQAEEEARIGAEQKLARDARYAARKAAKKRRKQDQKERPSLR
jgi:hypothetical protein